MASTAKVQVYGTKKSEPTRAVLWLCEMNDIPYDFVREDVKVGRKKRTYYINNINPNGRIPAIKDTNGFILYEAAAILQYLCTQYGLTYLYPSELRLRSKIDEYLHWHHENIRMITPAYFGHIARIDLPYKLWITKTPLFQRRKIVKKALDIIENSRLNNGKTYLANNQLSIADILAYEEIIQLYVWNLLSNGTNLGFDGDGSKYMKTNYPNIYRFIQTMRSLPKHDKIHEVMTTNSTLKQVKKRGSEFAKVLKEYKSKL